MSLGRIAPNHPCSHKAQGTATYVALKESLARRAMLDEDTLERLRAFGERLAQRPRTDDVGSA